MRTRGGTPLASGGPTRPEGQGESKISRGGGHNPVGIV
jgi:hypothetical protein